MFDRIEINAILIERNLEGKYMNLLTEQGKVKQISKQKRRVITAETRK